MTRLMHFRFAFAALATAMLLPAAWLESAWLAVPGVAAAGVADCIGLAQARKRFSRPVERALRGGAEALPAIGVAAFEPWAIGVTVGVVLFALMSNGMNTVMAARGTPPEKQPGETLRRALTGLACLMLLVIPVAGTTELNLAARLGADVQSVAVVATALVMLAGMRALLDMALASRNV